MYKDFIEQYIKIPQHIRYAIGCFFVGVWIILYFFWIHTSQQAKLQKLQDEYKKVETSLAQKRAFADHLPKYEARFNELQQAINTAKTMLPDHADVPHFLAQLGNAAQDVGLIINRFEPKNESYKDFYAEIAFSLLIHGSYHEMAMFIDQVGKFDRIVNISDISMTGPKKENQKVLLNGSLSVKTFRFLSAEIIAELESKKPQDIKK